MRGHGCVTILGHGIGIVITYSFHIEHALFVVNSCVNVVHKPMKSINIDNN